MQKKKIITIVLSVVLLIAIAVLGVANVYRVDTVTLVPSTISEEAEEEAVQLQERLEKAYAGSNTLFVDDDAAQSVLEDFPYFRITDFRKEFPNRIVIEASEDEEMFAAKVEGVEEYYVLGKDGILLGKRNTPDGRSGNNILVTGLTLSGEIGKVASGGALTDAFVQIIRAMTSVEGLGGTLRNNVTRIRLGDIAGQETMQITWREGVVAYIVEYEKNSAENAKKVVEKYLQLSDAQKVTGALVATTLAQDGSSNPVQYTAEDGFNSLFQWQ